MVPERGCNHILNKVSLFLTGLDYKELERSRNEAILDMTEHHVGEMTSCDLSIEHITMDTISNINRTVKAIHPITC